MQIAEAALTVWLWDVVRSGGVEYRLRDSVQLDGGSGISLPFSLRGQLGLLAKGARVLADTTAAGSATRCGSAVAY